MTALLDTWRRLEVNAYITFFDAILGRLLIAAGEPGQARTAWTPRWHWPKTPECISTTPNCCGYALTPTPTALPNQPTCQQRSNWPVDRVPSLFELRSSLDNFELQGRTAHAALADVLSRMPANSTLPESARARAAIALANSGHSAD